MAEEDKKTAPETGEEGTGDEAASGSKKKLVIIVVSLLFVLVAAGAGFFFMGGDSAENKAKQEAEQEAAKAEPQQSHFYELPDMTVNLASSGSRFLRLRVVLEVNSEQSVVKLQEIEPRLVDDFQVYLRELRPEDLRGSAGSYRLRHDLLLRANQAAQPVVVENVLFKEFLVQ